MSDMTCENCGGNITEEPNGICYCDTCGYVKYPDGITTKGVSDEDDKV